MKKIRYYLEYLLVRLFFILCRILPMEKASAMGGWIARHVGPYLAWQKRAKANLSYAMPELSSHEQAKILIKMWDNIGRTFAEYPHVARMNREQTLERLTVEGMDLLEELIANQTPALFASGHFGNWEMLPKLGHVLGMKSGLVYRRANNPFSEKLLQWVRSHYQSIAIPKGRQGSIQMIRALKNKYSLGLLVDQKMNDGIAIPFFGKTAMTAPAIATLSRKYGYPIIPSYVSREKGASFTIRMMDPIYAADFESDEAVMRHLNGLIEEWVRKDPSQWLWIHRRWGKISATKND